MIMLRFGKAKVPNKDFYGAKKTMKNVNVDLDDTVVSKLTNTKNHSNYLI